MHERLYPAATILPPMRLADRVTDRLVDVLVLAHELLGEFQTEEANELLWVEPRVAHVYHEVDALLRRLGS